MAVPYIASRDSLFYPTERMANTIEPNNRGDDLSHAKRMMSSGKTAAIGFIPILLIALVFGVYLNLSLGTNPNTTVNYSSFATNANTVNSTLGLKLVLTLNSTVIQSGQAINVTISVINVQPKVNNVSGVSDWALGDLKNQSVTNPTRGLYCLDPSNFLIFQGFYNQANITLAENALLLSQPGFLENCVFSNFSHFVFQPSGSLVNITDSYPPNYAENDNTFSMEASSSLEGNYSVQSAFLSSGRLPPNPFPVGVYTVIGGDEWGQLVLLHFQVVSPVVTTTSYQVCAGSTPPTGVVPCTNSAFYNSSSTRYTVYTSSLP